MLEQHGGRATGGGNGGSPPLGREGVSMKKFIELISVAYESL